MDYTDSPQVAEFRAGLREWLRGKRDLFGDGNARPEERSHAWFRELAGAGYVAVSLPAEFGGRGLPDVFEAVVNEEIARAEAPPPPPIGHIAHALADFGSPDLKRRFLPGLLSCRELWCQGFSEPGAGSDLAGIATSAVLAADGSHYSVSGHKIWTSGAMWSDWCLLLARTDSEASRHSGLSMMVLDLDSAGVDRHEIVMSNGRREFAEVHFDGVAVPAGNIVGAPGDGWRIAMSMLSYERGPADMGWVGRFGRALARAMSDVRDGRSAADPAMRHRLAAAAVNLRVLQWHVSRSLADRAHRQPGPAGSIDKLLAIRVEQDLYRTLGDLAGPDFVTTSPVFTDYVYSRAQSIYGGTQQIQRTIVAQRVLGLPRD